MVIWNDYLERGVGDSVDGGTNDGRRIRGIIIEVLSEEFVLVESQEEIKGGVPVGERVKLSHNDVND